MGWAIYSIKENRVKEKQKVTSHLPWQNPFSERLFENIRRDCLDHVIVLKCYASKRNSLLISFYYHNGRNHIGGFSKDTPSYRSID